MHHKTSLRYFKRNIQFLMENQEEIEGQILEIVKA